VGSIPAGNDYLGECASNAMKSERSQNSESYP